MRTKLVITYVKDENVEPVTVYIEFKSFRLLGILFFYYEDEDGNQVYLNRSVVFSIVMTSEEE